MSYEILSFHAQDPARPACFAGDLDPAAMLTILLKSARRFDADVELSVLTTADTDLSALRVPYRSFSYQIDFGNLMLERTRAQLDYLRREFGRRPIALLDSDIIINRDLRPLFAEDFDIALTCRPSRKGMPFNGGVLFINDKRPDAAIAFFEQLLSAYEKQFSDRGLWYGDQFAIASVVGLGAADVEARTDAEIDGIRYRFLPCSVFNASPDWRARGLVLTDVDNKILHFKERSRRLMKPIWEHRIDREGPRSLPEFAALAQEMAQLFLHSSAYRKQWKTDTRRALPRRPRPPLLYRLAGRVSGRQGAVRG